MKMKEKTQYCDMARLCAHAPFIKQVNNRRLQLRSAIFMAVGIVLIALTTLLHRDSDFLAILVLTLGVFVFVGALVHYIKGTNLLIYASTGEVLRPGSATYDQACAPLLRSIMSEEPDEEDYPVLSTDPNGGLQANYLVSADHQVLILGVRRFENLMWLPFADSVFLYTGKEAEKAIEALSIA